MTKPTIKRQKQNNRNTTNLFAYKQSKINQLFMHKLVSKSSDIWLFMKQEILRKFNNFKNSKHNSKQSKDIKDNF